MGIWETVLPGAASQLGNMFMQHETNRANIHQANRQMGWQGTMSANAHQIEVRDLIKAGLNPILSAGGNGASTPSPGAPSLAAPRFDFAPILDAVSLSQNQQRIDIDKAVAAAGIANTTSNTDLNRAKEILAKKGIIRATGEETLLKGIMDTWEYLKKQRRDTQKRLIPRRIVPGQINPPPP